MTIDELKKGLKLHNDINEVKNKLQQIRDYFQQNTSLKINVAGVEVEIPKATISQKIQGRIQELQDELNTLQTEFDNL